MTTILRTPAVESDMYLAQAPMSELNWKRERALLKDRASRQRKRTQRRAKKAAPRVPDFLHHLPASTCAALMESADHIDVFEKAKAQCSGVSQSDQARKLASGGSSHPRSSSSRGSVRSDNSSGSVTRSEGGVGLTRQRRPHRLQSLSSPDLSSTTESATRSKSRGSVGEFEIRPHGSVDASRKSDDKKSGQRRERRERREQIQNLGAKGLSQAGLPPILPIAGGSMTMSVGANGKEGTAQLVGREATELADLGGLISPSTIESFDFSKEFMTPEMMEEKQQRRARLRKSMRTARVSVSLHRNARDKQQSQALHSFLGGMKSRTRVKSLVNRHVRDEHRRIFTSTVV